MKVDGPKQTSQVASQKSKKTGKTGASGAFASELSKTGGDGATEAADAVEQTAPVATVSGVLAMQSVDPDAEASPEERKRRAQRGYELLDRLEEIRRGLLIGAIPKERLADLAQMVRQRREKGADPVVSKVLDEIELRASIELAKLSAR